MQRNPVSTGIGKASPSGSGWWDTARSLVAFVDRLRGKEEAFQTANLLQ
jgi:hypothetical protein